VIPEDQNRPPRPLGVTVLGTLLLLVCCCVLGSAAIVISRHPDQVFTGPSMSALLLRWVLPAAWIGATALGLLGGKAWARGSYFTLCILAFVTTAGALSADLSTQGARMRASFVVVVFICMAWGIWYLLGEKVKAWFR
jgi:drug/metabolite transporter (DMT)-like permease